MSLQSCDRRARCYEEWAATRTLAPGPPQARTFISNAPKKHIEERRRKGNGFARVKSSDQAKTDETSRPAPDFLYISCTYTPVYSIAFNFKKACVYTPTPVFQVRALLLFMKKAIIILYSRDRSEQKKGEEPRSVYTRTLRLDLIFILMSIYSFCRWLRCCLAVTSQMRPVHAKSPSFCRCGLPLFDQWIAKKFYSLNPSIPITRNIFLHALKSIRRVAVVIVLPLYVSQTCISEKIFFYFATYETNARHSSSNSSSGSNNSRGNNNLRRNDIKYLYSAYISNSSRQKIIINIVSRVKRETRACTGRSSLSYVNVSGLGHTEGKKKIIADAIRIFKSSRSSSNRGSRWIYYANCCATESAGTGKNNLKTCSTLKPTLIDGHKYTYPQELEKSSHVFVCGNSTHITLDKVRSKQRGCCNK
uniref:Uncharacterized protein n=1 Tax=Trichogramma kaykai TaxID=54128 RepID=A0ABD2WN83_9HYME